MSYNLGEITTQERLHHIMTMDDSRGQHMKDHDRRGPMTERVGWVF